jgi:DNA-binding transcriptional MocR family regulator
MSYKVDLSDIERGGETSLTQQLVDRFADAVESGVLTPGEKLPPTRQLAEDVGVNHLTAARVYRRLAELGYVTASVGRGTFVRTLSPAVAADEGDDWQLYALPEWEPSYSEQVMADAFNLPLEEGMISLSTGFPSPEHYPVADLARITAEVFEEEGGDAISYLPAEGLFSLREQLALRGQKYGFASEPEEIIVTSGAKQAINLTAQAILEPGDVVVCESPTFTGMLESFRSARARILAVPVDEDGFDIDALERLLTRHEVKLVALQTACQNPTGRDTSEERRERLAVLAGERSFFILEDRVYADLRFDRERPRALRELAPAHVVYVNSLSKSVGGGLRVGWVAVRGPLLERIAMLKLEDDFHTPTLVQHIASRYLASGAYDRHVESTLPVYRTRRDALLASLERHLAGEYRADPPRGGHHVWVTLNRPIDERVLYSEAIRHGVTFTPGGAVTPERRSQTAFRLSFSMLEPDELDEGVRRLARAIREVRRRTRQSRAVPAS